jgi:hypothetical protein
MLDRFWLRMAAMFGHSWVSQYGAQPDGVGGDTWSAVLADLTPQQIAGGLHATSRIAADWPPTAPRFRALCLGIPTMAECRIELRSGNPDPSPFARLLWSYLDGYNYRLAPKDKADKMLRDAYDLAAAFVMDGGALPEASPAITQAEPEPRKPADPETAGRYIAELQALFGERPAKTLQEDLADLEKASEADFNREREVG